MILPFWWRWAALGGLVAVCCLYTGIRVASHYEDRLAKINAIGVIQKERVRVIEVKQKEVNHHVGKDTRNLIGASDEYYRLRLKPGPGSLPSIPGSTQGAVEGTKADPADPETCTSADGAADAITLLMWQRWYREQRAAMESLRSNP